MRTFLKKKVLEEMSFQANFKIGKKKKGTHSAEELNANIHPINLWPNKAQFISHTLGKKHLWKGFEWILKCEKSVHMKTNNHWDSG